jgi:hypothetical protein
MLFVSSPFFHMYVFRNIVPMQLQASVALLGSGSF